MIKKEIFYLPKKEENFSSSLYEHLSFLPLQKHTLFVFEKEKTWLKLSLSKNFSCLASYLKEETCTSFFIHSLFQALAETLAFLKEQKLPLSLLSLSAKSIFFETENKHFYFCLLPLFQTNFDNTVVRKEECLEWLWLCYPKHLYNLSENDFLHLLNLLEKDFFLFLEEYFKKTKIQESTTMIPTPTAIAPTPTPTTIVPTPTAIISTREKQEKKCFYKENIKDKSIHFFAKICLFFSFFQSIVIFVKHKNFFIFLENNHFFFPLLCILSLLFLLLKKKSEKLCPSPLSNTENLKQTSLFYLCLCEKDKEEFVHLNTNGTLLSNDFSKKGEAENFFYTFSESTTPQNVLIKLHKENLQIQNLGPNVLVLCKENQKKKSLYPKESLWIVRNEIRSTSFSIEEVHFSFFIKNSFLKEEK